MSPSLAPLPPGPARPRFLARVLRADTVPAEVTTNRAHAYPRMLDELVPAALHIVKRHPNNPVDVDSGQLNARLKKLNALGTAHYAREHQHRT